ncbi:hypothetical protein SteCoe_11528 [Stentor coeruleus]|uniref:Uncharacterized protein n=1 Tax=Stentor coeruleus TaxID=5963 RepID=A0A1R2CD09_9CILI|nr:hypothetical protein SteCoe_11528 [Stentor coeruleus]
MGCCESTNAKGGIEMLSQKLKEAIDLGSINKLGMIISVYKKRFPSAEGQSFLDQEITVINNIHLNSLAYSLFLGKTNIFRFLYQRGASLKAMDDLLEKSSLRAINVICYKGHKDLLDFYLPLYLKNHNSLPILTKSFTIDLKDTITTRYESDLAIHSACRAGMFHIVSYIYNYFKDKNHIPREFDIFATDEYFCEDAGLIACRSGCFALVKMLHEVCGVDFKNLNNQKESSVMICVSAFKTTPNYSYIECVSYLVEVVGVDISYNYEELLTLAEGQEMVGYIESRLEKVGILTKKADVEKGNPRLRVVLREGDNGRNEQIFSEEARKYIEEPNSIVSSISEIGFKNSHGLASFLNNLN